MPKRKKKNESDASKKDVSGKENTKDKKNNIESQKCFTSVQLKKTTIVTKSNQKSYKSQ